MPSPASFSSSSSWLLLVLSLPTHSATGRTRIWRALKSLGCSALRDGAYLLPDRDATRPAFAALRDETIREGGSAWLLAVQPPTPEDETAYRALFDRDDDYATLIAALAEAGRSAPSLTPQELNRLVRKLRREHEAICRIDYFPGDARRRADAALAGFVQFADTLLAVGEPHALDADHAAMAPCDVADYQARQWATRRRLWVDRVASAWLIRRFIDPQARFLWLDAPGDCPPQALGFDFDGAAFTHVGERVTFEVLLARFRLDGDRGLARLGALVHVLDVGSGFVAEAAGFEAMLTGLRQRAIDDDQLLRDTTPVLDALYDCFSQDDQSSNSKRSV